MNILKKREQFTREQLRDIIFAIHDGASKRDAARKQGIPLTTLILRLRNPFSSPVGNPTAFTELIVNLAYEAPTLPSVPSESVEAVHFLLNYSEFLRLECPRTIFDENGIKKLEKQMKESIDRKLVNRQY